MLYPPPNYISLLATEIELQVLILIRVFQHLTIFSQFRLTCLVVIVGGRQLTTSLG